MSKDPFVQVPEFMAAFNNVLENGFFEDMQLASVGMEGTIISCSITASGFVPSEEQYKADGCGAIIDPNAVIASCRKLTDRNQVSDITTKIETSKWPLWDKAGKEVVGSKGKHTKLSLHITFRT